MPGYQLRPAIDQDRPFLFTLHRRTFHDYVAETWGRWDEAFQLKWFDDHFKLERRQIVVVDGKDIGCVEVERTDSEIVLALIEIAPEIQSRGIGTAIIEDILDEAKAGDIPVTLKVLKVNPAKRLYERLGFQVTHEDNRSFFLQARQRQP
jgi:ribosomal protein S18 acetylase RimI-like enzyme